jgi:citronellol/citronellal dehydrogenase
MGLLYHLEKGCVKRETRLCGGHRRCVRVRTARAIDLQTFAALHSGEPSVTTRHKIDIYEFLWYGNPINEIRTMKEMYIPDVRPRTTESQSVTSDSLITNFLFLVMAMTLQSKTLFITGASRGIGLAIALRAARDGANIVIAAKTVESHPNLPGTIYTAAEEIERAGGTALPLVVDVRDEGSVVRAFDESVQRFGGIDILVNNASAISLTDTPSTDMKRYDLMQQINVRGTYLCTRTALQYLSCAANPHVLNLAPPLDLDPKWFGPHVAYSIAKFGMSFCTLGQAREFMPLGIAVNSLWPVTTIDTAAVRNKLGDMANSSRNPEIMADAAYAILTKQATEVTGNFFLDEQVLREEGVTDFSSYARHPLAPLTADYFVSDQILDSLPTELVRLPQ